MTRIKLQSQNSQRSDFSSTHNLKNLIPLTPAPYELRTAKIAINTTRTNAKISKKEMDNTEKARRQGRSVVSNKRHELASKAGTVVMVVVCRRSSPPVFSDEERRRSTTHPKLLHRRLYKLCYHQYHRLLQCSLNVKTIPSLT